jgi:ArsR family transcriptional regulator, arsenate/arsenite/antimonite-responsive transcriptional repressor
MDRERIEQISKALGDETRLRIFEAINSREEMTCGEIVSLRDVTPATVSHHLRILVDAGLIETRREGQFVYSRANPETIDEYTRALSALTRKREK